MTGIKGAEATAAVEEVAADVYADLCDDGGNDDSGDNGDAFEMVREDEAAVAAA